MARIIREEFNRGRDFIVNRAVMVGGREFRPGNPPTIFDKDLVNARTLRQLYEQRVLGYHGVAVSQPKLRIPPIRVMSQRLQRRNPVERVRIKNHATV